MDKFNKYCIVCGQYSQGKPQCIDCWTASQDYANNLNKSHSYNLKWESLEYLFNQTVKKIKKLINQNKEISTSLCNQLIGIGFFENDYYFDANSKLLKKAYEEIETYNKNQENNKKYKNDNDNAVEDNTIITDTETIDFRKQFPADIHCNDGHYVRSKDERAIDDHLFSVAKLCHAYEPKFRLDKKEQEICKKAGKDYKCFYPDFYIPEYNLYIEYFGLNDEEHNQKKELKIKIMSNRKDINFRYLTYKDQNILIDKLEDILEEFKKPN